MRELERDLLFEPPACTRLTIVGAGRLGRALAAELRRAQWAVVGPLGRGADLDDPEVVLLCVPDAEIAGAAGALEAGVVVGHCSGATGLEVLEPHEGFSMHPLMTVTEDGAQFTGAGAAVAGNSQRALVLAQELAAAIGMRPVQIAPEDRPLYHAAASVASNFLVTLEGAAEQLAERAGLRRGDLVPLVRASVENWARLGAERALTGPIARGDEPTIAAQRLAVAERAPELLDLFDSMTAATRELAAVRQPA